MFAVDVKIKVLRSGAGHVASAVWKEHDLCEVSAASADEAVEAAKVEVDRLKMFPGLNFLVELPEPEPEPEPVAPVEAPAAEVIAEVASPGPAEEEENYNSENPKPDEPKEEKKPRRRSKS